MELLIDAYFKWLKTEWTVFFLWIKGVLWNMEDQIINILKLVNFVISRMNISSKYSYDDLYQEGTIRLINAVNNYNPKLKISFSTFAYVCIKNEILKYVNKNKINNISLDEQICEYIKLEDTIIDENANIEEIIIKNESLEILRNILNNELTDTERTIIKMLYGIDCPKYKQREISQMLNITQYKISRIKIRLLTQIKDCINNQNYKF